MRVTRAWGVALLSLVALTPLSARADLCEEGVVSGQKLRRAGRLLEARERFVMCSQAQCAQEVAARCLEWRREVEAATPSVIVVGQASDGKDLTQGKISIDGADRPEALGGRAISLDPGTHTLRLDVAGKSREESIVVREGERERRIVLRLEPIEAGAGRRPIPTGSIVAGGVGVVAAGASVFFGLRALDDRSAFGCDRGCPSSRYDRVQAEFVAADVALALAVGAFAVSGYLYFTRPVNPRAAMQFESMGLTF